MKETFKGLIRSVPESEAASVEERLARLEDERAIREIAAHYARCVDAKDAEGVASTFTEDGAFCGPGMDPLCGRERIAKVYGHLLGRMNSSTHLVGGEQVLFRGSDEAFLQCSFFAWEGFHEALVPEDRFTFGRYEFDLVKEPDGQWRARALYICFAGQTGSERFAEHLERPWPPESLV